MTITGVDTHPYLCSADGHVATVGEQKPCISSEALHTHHTQWGKHVSKGKRGRGVGLTASAAPRGDLAKGSEEYSPWLIWMWMTGWRVAAVVAAAEGIGQGGHGNPSASRELGLLGEH